MTDSEQPDPFGAYQSSLSGPDPATTRRMQDRLDEFLGEELGRHKRARILWRIGGVVGVAILVVAIGSYWRFGGRAGDGQVVIVAEDRAQTMRLTQGGRARALPSSRVVVEHDDTDGAILRLDGGAVELDVPERAGTSWRVRVGSHQAEAVGAAQFRVREGQGAPAVTVVAGSVRLTGPNLPGGGLLLEPDPG